MDSSNAPVRIFLIPAPNRNDKQSALVNPQKYVLMTLTSRAQPDLETSNFIAE